MAWQIQSPDAMLGRVQFDPDGSAQSDQAELPVLFKLERSLIDELRDQLVRPRKVLDLHPDVLQVTGDARQLVLKPAQAVLKPALNPYLVAENLATARTLYADCLELRRRIEALQLDLFNYSQETYEHEEDLKRQSEELAQAQKDIDLYSNLIAKAGEAKEALTKHRDAWRTATTNYGATSVDHGAEARKNNAIVLGYWPLRFTVTSTPAGANDEARFVRVSSNTIGAGLIPNYSGPDLPVWEALKATASRESALACESLDSQLRTINLDLKNHESELIRLNHLKASAEQAKKTLTDLQATRNEKWKRKAAQMTGNGSLDLARRLSETLPLYAASIKALKQAIHAVEYGQSVVFGMTGFSFDPLAKMTVYRYELSRLLLKKTPRLQSLVMPTDPMVLQSQSTDPIAVDLTNQPAPWISLDELGGDILAAEERLRKESHACVLREASFLFAGEIPDGDRHIELTASINIPELQSAGSADGLQAISGVAGVSKPKRMVAIKIINEGPPVSATFSIKTRVPKHLNRLDQYGFTMSNDARNEELKAVVGPVLSQYEFKFSADYLPTATGANPAFMPPPSMFVNRELQDKMTLNASIVSPDARQVAVRVNVLYCVSTK